MTREDIIRMIREAGLQNICVDCDEPDVRYAYDSYDDELYKFAELVAAAEREACAKLAVEESAEWHICSQSHDTANMIAAAIRARGQ